MLVLAVAEGMLGPPIPDDETNEVALGLSRPPPPWAGTGTNSPPPCPPSIVVAEVELKTKGGA